MRLGTAREVRDTPADPPPPELLVVRRDVPTPERELLDPELRPLLVGRELLEDREEVFDDAGLDLDDFDGAFATDVL